MKLKHVVVVFASLPVLVYAQVTAPRAGSLKYPDGSVRTLYGLPGNLLLGNSNIGPARAVSCSSAGCLVARSGRIELLSPNASDIGVYPSTESAPLLNIGATLRTAIAWLPGAHVLLRWNGQSFTAVPVDDSAFDGSVTSVALTASQPRFLVTHSDGLVSGVIVSLQSGNLVSSDLLPGIHGPAFEIGSDVLWLEDRTLQIEDANGARSALPLAAPDIVAERMSANWVHLFSPSSGAHWALHLNGTARSLSLIPSLPAAKESK